MHTTWLGIRELDECDWTSVTTASRCSHMAAYCQYHMHANPVQCQHAPLSVHSAMQSQQKDQFSELKLFPCLMQSYVKRGWIVGGIL